MPCRIGATGFHAYKSVAPLKPYNAGCPHDNGDVFPRLQKRGPIEALAGGDGPGDAAGEFPRLQKRGPIEALRKHGNRASLSRRFHAYKSVAPLKLPVGAGLQVADTSVSTLTKAWPH